MPSILAAESAPHRGRAIALAATGLFAALALSFGVARHHHAPRRPHHAHHGLRVMGHCSTTVYLLR